jgi:hypothetical protein
MRNEMKRYHGSLAHHLHALYPNHYWEEWRFKSIPRGFWNNPDNRTRFLDQAAKELKVKDLEDWYSVKTKDIEKLHGAYYLVFSNFEVF